MCAQPNVSNLLKHASSAHDFIPFSNACTATKTCAFQTFRQDPHATEEALHLPTFPLQLGEGKLQSEETQPVQLSLSDNIRRDPPHFLNKVFTNLESKYQNESWIAQRAVLTTVNERLQELNNGEKELISRSEKTFQSAYFVDKAEVSKLNYPVKLLNSIVGPASFPGHKQTLGK